MRRAMRQAAGSVPPGAAVVAAVALLAGGGPAGPGALAAQRDGPAAAREGVPVRAPSPPVRHVFERSLMGTRFRIVLHGPDAGAARAAADLAFARVDELERVLSDYDPASELSRLSDAAGDGRWVPVSDDLWAVLVRAAEWSERTDGAFDVTVGPLTRLWRRAARRGRAPSAAEAAAARSAVGRELLDLDPSSRSVRLREPGMRLDAGGIGKGYAADAAIEVLAARGFPSALVDAGGDVVAGDPPPGEEGWRVAVAGRDACVVLLRNQALATSGDAHRAVEVDGVVHSHILDPRTGAALTHRGSVTVLAPTGTDADALASALSVLGPAEGRALLARHPAATRLIPHSLHSCPEPS